VAHPSRAQPEPRQPATKRRRLPGDEHVPVAQESNPVAPTLAADLQSSQEQAQLLGDPRIPAGQRRQVAAWLGRARGNRYLQRLIDPTRPSDDSIGRIAGPIVQREGETSAAGGGEAATAETESETPSLEQQLREALARPSADDKVPC